MDDRAAAAAAVCVGGDLMFAPTTTAQERIREDVTAQIERQFQQRIDAAPAHGPEFTQLWRLAATTVRGGKMIRPLLLVQSAQALTLASGAQASATPEVELDETVLYQVAAALELLHYSFVLHDDVIDGDYVRRHRPNLQGALRHAHPHPDSAAALHWARSGGILMGDLLLAAVHQQFARLDLPHAARERMLDLLDHTITETVAGEHLDVGLSDGAVGPDLHTTLVMTSRKTATYSFELPLRAAAVLTGADAAVEAELTAAGRHLGHAFQLQDDLLSAFGDGQEHGKDVLSDFREGKQTAIIAHARFTSHWPEIESRLGAGHLSEHDRRALRTALEDCGSRDFVASLVRDELDALHAQLTSESALPSPMQHLLREQAMRLQERRS